MYFVQRSFNGPFQFVRYIHTKMFSAMNKYCLFYECKYCAIKWKWFSNVSFAMAPCPKCCCSCKPYKEVISFKLKLNEKTHWRTCSLILRTTNRNVTDGRIVIWSHINLVNYRWAVRINEWSSLILYFVCIANKIVIDT